MSDLNPDWHVNDDGKWETGTGQILATVHSPDKCAGQHCTVHNPSNHHMRSFPTHYREDRGITERICPHGVGHPDFDDPTSDTTHGCDGCCRPPGGVQFDESDTHCVHGTYLHEDVCLSCAPIAGNHSDPRNRPLGPSPFDADLQREAIEDFKRKRMANPFKKQAYMLNGQESALTLWIEQMADAELYEQRWHELENEKDA